MIEWGDNASIADQPPASYLRTMKEYCTAKDHERMYCHALPDKWEAMPYHDFLVERRERIAAVIQDSYKLLSIGTEAEPGWPLAGKRLILSLSPPSG